MSYWDILTDDLKQHIIDMRDNKIKNENKNNPDYQFKIGNFVLPPCEMWIEEKCKYWLTSERIESSYIQNPRVKKFDTSRTLLPLNITINKINFNKHKLTIYVRNNESWKTKLYYPKLSFDENHIPFFFIKNQLLNVNDKIYFKDLISFRTWHNL